MAASKQAGNAYIQTGDMHTELLATMSVPWCVLIRAKQSRAGDGHCIAQLIGFRKAELQRCCAQWSRERRCSWGCEVHMKNHLICHPLP